MDNPMEPEANTILVELECPKDGDVLIVNHYISMFVHPTLPQVHIEYTCPKCTKTLKTPVPPQAALTLRAMAGVACHSIEVPAEALEVRDEPALTLDYMIDLNEDLKLL